VKAKLKTIYRCQECGFESSKWLGKCTDCGKWNTFAEEREMPEDGGDNRLGGRLTDFTSEVTLLNDVSTAQNDRWQTGIGEFDRIVGGGLVPGSLLLLGGPPGIGKSTLMLHIGAALSPKHTVLYVSGEESLAQVKARADRLGIKCDNLYLLSETNLESIIAAIDKIKPDTLVIDSIQTTYRGDMAGAPGAVGQVKECAAEFLRIAKSRHISVFLLGHVTKEGDLAGPRILEHIVDTVLYFEAERLQVYRVLRVYKNRFGPTNEIGVFEMRERGLIEVPNPSLVFLGERSMNAPGSVVVPTIEGTRPLLLEIQSLVSRTSFGLPRRMVSGYDANRVMLLIAVLEKRVGLHLETQDVFVNVVSGIKIKETAVDLGIACAVASANGNYVCPPKTLIVGEVGLAGEVRSVSRIEERLAEGEKLGFEKAIIPNSNLKALAYKGSMQVAGVDTVSAAIEHLK
jgi:DNA repair protein RadA/Sms